MVDIVMQRRNYLRTAGTLGVGTITGLAGCTGSLGGSNWDATIGLCAPTSGPLGVLGEPIIQGGQMAVEDVNENSDREISYEVGDTAGQAEEALNLARQMNHDGNVMLAGMIVSDVGLALREYAENNNYPMMGSFTGNTNITASGSDYYFRCYSNNRQSTAGVLQFFSEQNVSNIAVISLNDSYGREVSNATEEFAEEVGINIEFLENVDPGTTNFQPIVSQINNDAIDGIAIPYHGRGQVALTEQLQEAGLWEDNIILGDTSWGSISVYKEPAGENAEGLHFWGVDLSTQEAQELSDRMNDEYGGETGTYRITGYDTVRIAAEAVANADSVTPEAVRDELQNTSYDGAGGWSTEFDDSGDNDVWQLIVNRWETSNGEIVSSDPIFKSDPIPGDSPADIFG